MGVTTALWCVLLAGLLPYLATIIAKVGGERYNNRDPRAWLDRQSGWRRRADSAQRNGFEAFPLFAAGVLVAQWAHAPQSRIDLAALLFIAARLAYLGCYVANWHYARSLTWLVGLLASVTLFFLGA
jgi:uncharacterized MAPEG superfamily protein